jgi:hypothetical protein
LYLRKSNDATVGGLTQTDQDDELGTIVFMGVNTSNVFDQAVRMQVKQSNVASASVEADLRLETVGSSGWNADQLYLAAAGGVAVGAEPYVTDKFGVRNYGINTLLGVDHYYDSGSLNGAGIMLRASRGASIGSLVTTQNNDYIGRIEFYGVSTSTVAPELCGGIHLVQDGAASALGVPTTMRIFASSDAVAPHYNQLVLSENGYVGIQEQNPDIQLDVDGGLSLEVTTDDTTTGIQTSYDVTNVSVLLIGPLGGSPGTLDLNSLAGGVDGQILHIHNRRNSNVLLKNQNGGAGQDMYLQPVSSGDITLGANDYEGVTLVHEGGAWFIVSKAS